MKVILYYFPKCYNLFKYGLFPAGPLVIVIYLRYYLHMLRYPSGFVFLAVRTTNKQLHFKRLEISPPFTVSRWFAPQLEARCLTVAPFLQFSSEFSPKNSFYCRE